MKKRTRRNYTQEFKEEAVKLITNQGYSFAEAGRNLGVNPNVLIRWKKEIEGVDGSGLSPASAVSVQSELKRLRKENKRLRMEREILKKAAVDSIDQSNTLYYNTKNNNMEIAFNETNGSSRYVHRPEIRGMVSLEKR
jgi:transposase